MDKILHIDLSEQDGRNLTFYLALEEYLVDHCQEDVFFIWQVDPTVIFGRNQDMEAEVNVEYCEKNGIRMFRRKSGGGCVYSDRGNVMLSYVTKKKDVDTTFNYFLDALVGALSDLGINAVKSTHNDVMICDRKVSGNAFFKTPNGSIVHGTLLYDSDFEVLQKAITPSKEKLNSHGIKSVRQRVMNLTEVCPIELGKLKEHLVGYFCDRKRKLTDDELSEIEMIEKTYTNPKFILGK